MYKLSFRRITKALTLLLIPIIVMLAMPINTKAASSSYGYEIDDYYIHVTVNEDSTMVIDEYITVTFNEARHGIFRNIPLINYPKRYDGTVDKLKAKVKDVTCNEPFTKETTSQSDYIYYDGKAKNRTIKYYQMKIGDKDTTLIGSGHEYHIQYTYSLENDSSTEYDELYLNLIGTGWDTTIANASFEIDMPKDFPTDKLSVYSGTAGGVDESNVTWYVDGNTISATTLGEKIRPGEAFTIRLQLDEGYFTQNPDFRPTIFSGEGFQIFLRAGIPIILLVIAIYLWFKYCRSTKPVVPVEFYPPEGMNSAELGMRYKGYVDNPHITSLLVYLASKGFVTIKERGKDITIIKNKDYTGHDGMCSKFMNGLFIGGKTSVKAESLKNSFYKTTDRIRQNLEDINKVTRVKTRFNVQVILGLMAAFCIIIESILAQFSIDEGFGETFMLQLFVVIGTIVFSIAFGQKIAMVTKVFFWVWGSMFSMLFGIPIVIFALDETINEWCFVGYICAVGILLLKRTGFKRTDEANEIYGRIKGFRYFLKTVERDKLEQLVSENPSYFYDILPYTYVLGLSRKWISKFEGILTRPDWYDSDNTTFNAHSFNRFMSHTVSQTGNSMSSRPSSGGSSGGGGSSSGGGSSGGGSGGGGGGSW